jgi:hypothetical protein
MLVVPGEENIGNTLQMVLVTIAVVFLKCSEKCKDQCLVIITPKL